MTYEEAIHILWEFYEKAEIEGSFKFRGALDKTTEAVEKQIPKTPVRRTVNIGYNLLMPVDINVCPVCGVEYGDVNPNPRELESYMLHCPDCGQLLDWSE